MNVSEFGSDKRTCAFNILTVIWVSLLIATGLFFPVMTVVPDGPAFDLLRTVFLVMIAAMLSLALLITILVVSGAVSVPRTSESEDLPWPIVLVAGLLLTCILASSLVVGIADHAGTGAALAQLGVLLGLFMLPFVLAIIVPLIIRRFSGDYARKAGKWGYSTAMLIDVGMWFHFSGKSLSFVLEILRVPALVAIAYLIFLAVRRVRRNARSAN